nr:MAG TPA: hypothetical protein [Caudoviricetes sp.]
MFHVKQLYTREKPATTSFCNYQQVSTNPNSSKLIQVSLKNFG